jgi:hypothetical protein
MSPFFMLSNEVKVQWLPDRSGTPQYRWRTVQGVQAYGRNRC